MELLKQRIREEGIVLNNRVLKVDGFLDRKSTRLNSSHQI